MCGIVAAFDRRGALDEAFVRPALRALRHRGPDGQGIYVARDRCVALGHTRLAVVDLQGGVQPLVHTERELACVVNGELYDVNNLRGRLARAGARFQTRSDSELLLHAYAERGLDCLPELHGEFAFALWDGEARRLVVGRDRFGIKPAVVSWNGSRALVASEAKALFVLGVAPRWDVTAVQHAVSHQYLPPRRTMFEGIDQIPAGHVWIVGHKGDPQLVRYWDVPAPTEPSASATESDLMQGTRSLLEDAVRLRLRGDVPVCVHLSGGLDSAAVAAFAQRSSGRALDAFCVRFDEPAYQEDQHAREVARCLGLNLNVVDVDEGALIDSFSDAVFHGETLGINGQLPAKLCLSRAIKAAGFKVVLSGEGADEAWLGYAHLWHDAGRAPRDDGAQQGIMLASGPCLPMQAVERMWGAAPHFLSAKAGIGARMRPLLASHFRERLQVNDPFFALARDVNAEAVSGWHRVARGAYLWTKLALAGYILRALGDGMEMAASVEGRTPFLAHRLFEHAQALGMDRRLAGGIEKHHLREALCGIVPEAVRLRPKHPFLAPPLRLEQGGAAYAFVQDWLASAAFQELPFFDAERTRSFIDEVAEGGPSARVAGDPVVMLVVSMCLMQARFGLATGKVT